MRSVRGALVTLIALGACTNHEVRDDADLGGASRANADEGAGASSGVDSGETEDASRNGRVIGGVDASKNTRRPRPSDAAASASPEAGVSINSDTTGRGDGDDPAPAEVGFWRQHFTSTLKHVDRSEDVFEVPRLSIALGDAETSHVDGKILSISNVKLSLGASNQPEPLGFETSIFLTLPGELPLTIGETIMAAVPKVAVLLRSRVVSIRDTETMAATSLATLHYTDSFLGWALHSKRELMFRVRSVSSELFIRYTYEETLSPRASTLLPKHVRAFQWLEAPAYSAQNEAPAEQGSFLTASDVDGAPLLALTVEPEVGGERVAVHNTATPEKDHSFRVNKGNAMVQWRQSHFARDLSHVYIPLSAPELRAVDANLLMQTQTIVPYAKTRRAPPAYVSHDGKFETSISNEVQEWNATVSFTLSSKDEQPLVTNLTYDIDMRLALEDSFVRFAGEFGVKHRSAESESN